MTITQGLSSAKAEVIIPTLLFERVTDTAKEPIKAKEKDGGWDVFADESYILKPFERKRIKTGLKFQLTESYSEDNFVWILDIRPKSGLADSKGLTISNSPGLLDEGYRGELEIICYNSDPSYDIQIITGQKLAQVVLSRSYKFVAVEGIVDSDTDRGTGGFGSTGI
jgi:dUTP pyrophosphatase